MRKYNSVFTIISLLFIYPIGLFLLWKKSKFKNSTKIILTIVFSILLPSFSLYISNKKIDYQNIEIDQYVSKEMSDLNQKGLNCLKMGNEENGGENEYTENDKGDLRRISINSLNNISDNKNKRDKEKLIEKKDKVACEQRPEAKTEDAIIKDDINEKNNEAQVKQNDKECSKEGEKENKNRNESKEKDKPKDQKTVYITPKGKKYHYKTPCGVGNFVPISIDEAEKIGYSPCKKCAKK